MIGLAIAACWVGVCLAAFVGALVARAITGGFARRRLLADIRQMIEDDAAEIKICIDSEIEIEDAKEAFRAVAGPYGRYHAWERN